MVSKDICIAVSYMLRTLRSAVSQRTRFFSSNRRLDRLGRRNSTETIQLFRKIEGFLKHAPKHAPLSPENIIGYISRELDNTLPNVKEPHILYERIISFLIGREYAQEAVLLYQRMHEVAGFLSSDVLDTKILAMALAIPNQSPEPIILRIAPIFADPDYTENDFSSLLKTMEKYGVDKDIICTLVETYISTRRPDFIFSPQILAPILSARTLAGDVDVALELLDQFSGVNNHNRSARTSLHAPYVQILAALLETRTWDSASVNRILDLMKNQGLPHTLPTLNILLSREVRLGNHRSAIAIYSMLKQMRLTKKMSPDTFTFGSMFLLYRMTPPKTVRNHHHKDLASPFPPRALYHDFMLAAKPKFNADRIVPSTTLMNVILRAFVRQRDYAGAFVVLGSFSLFRLHLDHQTYYRVVKHVVRRIWLEVSRGKGGGWSLMFLGVPDYSHIELNEDLVQNLFAFVSRDTFRLNSPLVASHRHMPPTIDERRYELPTMNMMESLLDPEPLDFYYDPVPLKRILRRAILATLHLTNPKAGPADVSKAIADAKVDMLPKIPQRTPSPASIDVLP
jgi:hypothetical protein